MEDGGEGWGGETHWRDFFFFFFFRLLLIKESLGKRGEVLSAKSGLLTTWLWESDEDVRFVLWLKRE